ncbi:cytosine permease [Nocardioides panacisoli]|uniref:cytosine permease n=1 Tax=Nocardioides panacisoli TaxID=627624 RepID=UPI001C62669A|nr:cytosine permease [Nocardioides panacisoli]QYJ02893.1 cytosine permease [Nocardioides panacisoli]
MSEERTTGVEDAVIDPDYPLDPVPPHARRGLLPLSLVLLGFTFFTPTMLVGAQVGAAFTLGDFLLVMLLGSAVLGVYVAMLALVGARTRLTTVMLSRYTLGTQGSKLASLLLGFTQIGWYGVGVATLGNLIAEALGWGSAGATLWMVVGTVVMGTTAYFGFRGLFWLSAVSVPLMFLLAAWVVLRSVEEVGGWDAMAAIEPTDQMSTTLALTLIVGTFVSGGTQVSNWTRFARNGRQAFGAGLIAFMVGNGLMLFFGAIGAIAFGEADFVLVLYNLGLIVWGVVLLIGNIWTTNDNTAYAFSVAGAEIANWPSKKPFVVGGVAIGGLLAITGIYDSLISYLVWLSILIPPLGGTLIGDWWCRWRHGVPERAAYAFRTVEWRCLAAYAVGVAAAFTADQQGWGLPAVIGILVALAAAVALNPAWQRREEVADADGLPQRTP